jgi:outer membrane protein OmpA-like peptidoglycan-associated protein
MAIGHQKGPSYGLGVAISSLIKVKLLPSTDVDLNAVVTESDRQSLEALQSGGATFALVPIDNARPPSSPDIRAVATLGRSGDLALTLLVRQDADDASVQIILKTILDNVDFLQMIDQRAVGLTADAAMLGLSVPLHDGAKRFYMQQWASSGSGASPSPSPAAVVPADRLPATTVAAEPSIAGAPVEAYVANADGPADARNFVLYFDFDDATLNDTTQTVLRDAARFASTLDNPAIIVAAYTDSAGNADYNYLLAERRAGAVMSGLNSLGVHYSDIQTSLYGERSPWALTLDGVNEASNRRVELFIEEPVETVQLLPVAGDAAGAPALQQEPGVAPAGGEIETIPASTAPLPRGGPQNRILPLRTTM